MEVNKVIVKIEKVKSTIKKAYKQQSINISSNTHYTLSENALEDVAKAVSETQEQALNNPGELIKLKDNTIKELVDYEIPDNAMMVRKGHLRENILTEEQAKKLGYSTKNKHFHGLGVKIYLEIIDSMDNPIGVYQYTGMGQYGSNNFIVLTPIKINGKKAIVPIEINNKGTYNNVDIDYNRIKTTYSKDNHNYIEKMIEKGELVEIKKKNHMQSNSAYSSSTENNISHNNEKINNTFTNSNMDNNVIYVTNEDKLNKDYIIKEDYDDKVCFNTDIKFILY